MMDQSLELSRGAQVLDKSTYIGMLVVDQAGMRPDTTKQCLYHHHTTHLPFWPRLYQYPVEPNTLTRYQCDASVLGASRGRLEAVKAELVCPWPVCL